MAVNRRTGQMATLTPTRDPTTGITTMTNQSVVLDPGLGIDFDLGGMGLPGSGPTSPTMDPGQLVKNLGVDGCSRFLPRSICQSVADALLGGGGGGGGAGQGYNGGQKPRGFTPADKCGSGYTYNPENGVCEFTGSPGDLSTNGNAGLPPGAARATVIGEIHNNPIYRCPKRFVLADPELFGDGVCFHKSTIPNSMRKWPKAARPPITAYDAKMMRRYGPGGSKQKKVKELAGKAGFSCKKR